MLRNYILLTLLFVSLGTLQLCAQDLGNLKNQKPIQLSSGLSLSSGFYSTNSGDNRQTPFNWVLSGSPTVTIYGISFPFSFMVSNQQRSVQQPFNRFGVAPNWKWIKVHLGWSSMNFSQYTLSGRQFLGAGVELTPKRFRFGAMYGRFQKAIREDSIATNANNFISNIPIPAFERRGYAFKLGLGGPKNHFDLVFMKASDQSNSIPSPVSTPITPEENTSFGITTQFTFFKAFTWKLDAGLSAFTRDLNSDSSDLGDVPYRELIEKIISPKNTTQAFTAGETSLGFRKKQFSIDLKYKRIDPGYRSMGVYYFQSDMQQYSITSAFPMGKSLRLSSNIGFQENNLLKKKLATTRRFIGSGNLSFNPPKGIFGFDLSYSNFGITQAPGLRSLSDSTRLQQVSQSINFSPRLNFNNDARTQSYFLLLSLSDLADRNPNIVYKSDTRSYVANLGYNLVFTKSQLNFNANAMLNTVQIPSGKTQSFGGGIGIGKSYKEGKISINLNTSWFSNSYNGKSNGSSLTATTGISYAIAKKQSANFNLSWLNNQTVDTTVSPSFSEIYGNLGYSINF